MKVLYLTNVPSPYRVSFFNELAKYCDLTVAFEVQSARDRDKLWYLNTEKLYREIFLNGVRIGDDTGLCFNVFKLFRDKFDVIVISGYSTPTGMIAVKWLHHKKIPFIISCDGGFIKEDSPIKYWVKRSLIHTASAWLSTGEETNKYLCHYGADTDRIYEYPFTSLKEDEVLEKPNFETKAAVRAKLNITEKQIVLSVGQFIYRKGFDILIEALKNIKEDIGIYIVGGEPSNEYLKQVDEYKLNNIHFVGFKTKKELADYYLAADIFVLPTREDIWGLVINEAMASGLPIITTKKCIAGLEMIKDGYNGFLVPIDEVEGLSDKIKLALRDERGLNDMGENSLKVIRNYTIEKMALRHIEIFEDYIG